MEVGDGEAEAGGGLEAAWWVDALAFVFFANGGSWVVGWFDEWEFGICGWMFLMNEGVSEGGTEDAIYQMACACVLQAARKGRWAGREACPSIARRRMGFQEGRSGCSAILGCWILRGVRLCREVGKRL